MYEDFHYFFKPVFNSPSIIMSDTGKKKKKKKKRKKYELYLTRLFFSFPDSFLFYCQGIDNIEEIIHTHADRFDLSNLGDHWLRDDRNCKVRKKKKDRKILRFKTK